MEQKRVCGAEGDCLGRGRRKRGASARLVHLVVVVGLPVRVAVVEALLGLPQDAREQPDPRGEGLDGPLVQEHPRVVQPECGGGIRAALNCGDEDDPHAVGQGRIRRLEASAEAAGARVKVCGERAEKVRGPRRALGLSGKAAGGAPTA